MTNAPNPEDFVEEARRLADSQGQTLQQFLGKPGKAGRDLLRRASQGRAIHAIEQAASGK